MLARAPRTITVGKDDHTTPYILLTNNHDGNAAVRIFPTAVRVVCANTLNLALGARDRSKTLSVWHTASMRDKLRQAPRLIREALGLFDHYERHAHTLAAHTLTRTDWATYRDGLFPDDPTASERARNAAQRTRDRLDHLYHDDPRQNLDGIAGTAWSAFNAVTDYLDHDTRTTGDNARAKQENRFRSVIDGSSAKKKAQALTHALALCN